MGGKSGGGEAAQARADEEARQARIRAGTADINRIFDGGTRGSGLLGSSDTYDPTKTYYNSDGSIWTPTVPVVAETSTSASTGTQGSAYASRNGSDTATSTPSASSQAFVTTRETATPQKDVASQFSDALANGLYSGTTTSNGFDDAFYNGRRQAYIDYATPQLEDQYADAQKQLTYALARGGLLDSSVRGSKLGELQQQYALQNQAIADKALASETDARNAVEDARSNLITTLNATGDAQQAASTAIARASALSQPAAYSPLASLFADFTDALGTQSALSRANSYAGSGTGSVNYKTGLFSNTGSVRNSR